MTASWNNRVGCCQCISMPWAIGIIFFITVLETVNLIWEILQLADVITMIGAIVNHPLIIKEDKEDYKSIL